MSVRIADSVLCKVFGHVWEGKSAICARCRLDVSKKGWPPIPMGVLPPPPPPPVPAPTLKGPTKMSNHHHDRMHHLLDIMLQAQEALAEAKRRHEPAYQAAREAQYEIGNLESAADIAVEKLYRAMLGRPEKMEPPKHEPEEKKAE